MNPGRRVVGLMLAGIVSAAACEGHRSALERERLLGVLDDEKDQGASPTAVDLFEVLFPALYAPQTAAPAPHPLLANRDAAALRAELGRPAARPVDALVACAVAHAWGEANLVVDRCADVLDRFSDDEDADVAALVLWHWRSKTNAVKARADVAWLGSPCRGVDPGCARRQWAVSRLLDAVRGEGGADDVGRAQARVTGPFDGDGAFAAARLQQGEPLVERPLRTRSFSSSPSPRGAWRPARHDESGWYRLELFVDVARAAPVGVALSTEDVVVLGADDDTRLMQFGGERPSMRVVWFAPEKTGVHRLTLHARFTSSEQPFSARVVSGLAALVAQQPTPRGALPLGPVPDVEPPTAPRQWISILRSTFGADMGASEVVAAWGDLPSPWLTAPAGLALSAGAVDRLSRIPTAERTAIRTRLFAALAVHWPHQPQLGLAAVRRARKDERHAEARAAMDALIAAHPEETWLRRHRVPIVLEAQDIETARGDAAALGGEQATAEDLAAAAQVASALDDLATYARLTDRRLALTGTDDLDGLARRFARGDAGAEAALLDRMERDPGGAADDLWLQRAELFDPDKAAQHLDILARRFPNAPAWALRGETLSGVSSDRLVERFSGREEVFFARPLPPDVDEAVTVLKERVAAYVATPDTTFAGEELVFIDDTVSRTIHADGSAHVVRTYAVALQGRTAVDAFGEINVDGAERVLALFVTRPDKTVREPERAEGVSDVTLTGLAPGDVVAFASLRLEARTTWPYPAFEIRTLQNRAAALSRTHILRWPLEMTEIQPVWGHGAPPPRRTTTARMRKVMWTVDHVSPLPGEPFSGPDETDGPYAGYRWRDADESWAAARSAGWQRFAASNGFLGRLARRVLNAQPDAEPAKALRRYVTEAVAPGANRDAVASVWTRAGDRLVTFAALCRAAGIEVVPLALELPERVGAEGLDPRRYGLAGVQIGGDETQVVVGTRSLSPIGRLPRWLDGAVRLDLSPKKAPQGFFARLLLPEEDRRESLPRDIVESDPVVTQIALERAESGEWVGALRITVPPAEAGVVQEALASSPAEALQDVFARWLAAGYPQARVGRVRFSPWIRGGQPLVVAVEFSLAAQRDADELVLADAVPGLASVLLQLSVDPTAYLNPAERSRTLFRQPLWETLEVQIDVDSRETFVEVPQNVDVDLEGLAIEQRVELTDGRFLMRRWVRVEGGTASPASWAESRPEWGGALRKLEAPLRVVAAPRQTAQNKPSAATGR